MRFACCVGLVLQLKADFVLFDPAFWGHHQFLQRCASLLSDHDVEIIVLLGAIAVALKRVVCAHRRVSTILGVLHIAPLGVIVNVCALIVGNTVVIERALAVARVATVLDVILVRVRRALRGVGATGSALDVAPALSERASDCALVVQLAFPHEDVLALTRVALTRIGTTVRVLSAVVIALTFSKGVVGRARASYALGRNAVVQSAAFLAGRLALVTAHTLVFFCTPSAEFLAEVRRAVALVRDVAAFATASVGATVAVCRAVFSALAGSQSVIQRASGCDTVPRIASNSVQVQCWAFLTGRGAKSGALTFALLS
jgi:hypothetical protein